LKDALFSVNRFAGARPCHGKQVSALGILDAPRYIQILLLDTYRLIVEKHDLHGNS